MCSGAVKRPGDLVKGDKIFFLYYGTPQYLTIIFLGTQILTPKLLFALIARTWPIFTSLRPKMTQKITRRKIVCGN